MTYWIVSSRYSRDESTRGWELKWTADSFLRTGKFYPYKRHRDFRVGDRCILKVFGAQNFVADFEIASLAERDTQNDLWYTIGEIYEWDFPIHQHTLPKKYTDQLNRNVRNPSIEISEQDFFELLGIRNFTQNLRLNYRNRLLVHISEKEVESLLDSRDTLKSLDLEVVDRQRAFTPGNIIDLLCRDSRGDLVVVELKKDGANQTVGQLARYITDVREHYAKSTQKVSGLILALDIDEQLVKAARGVDFDVALCQLTFG